MNLSNYEFAVVLEITSKNKKKLNGILFVSGSDMVKNLLCIFFIWLKKVAKGKICKIVSFKSERLRSQ